MQSYSIQFSFEYWFYLINEILRWKKDVNKLQMVFNTHLWNERKITCPERDSNLHLPILSWGWYPLHHRVNHCTWQVFDVYGSNTVNSTHFSFERFVCIMAKFSMKFWLCDNISKAFLAFENFCLSWNFSDTFILRFAVWSHYNHISFYFSIMSTWSRLWIL